MKSPDNLPPLDWECTVYHKTKNKFQKTFDSYAKIDLKYTFPKKKMTQMGAAGTMDPKVEI